MYIGNVFLATISVPLRALRNYEALLSSEALGVRKAIPTELAIRH